MRIPFRFLTGLAALLCASAFADTITLKTGEKVEGKIVAETDAELTVEVKISAAVTDETKILKANVAKIEKEQPDELAWPALKNLKPGVNSLAAEQYDAAIRPLQAFVNEYPKSAHAAEASQLLAIFAGEKERVEGGEVRLGEKWLSKEEVDKERYQISGLLYFQNMRAQRAAGDFSGTLNSFDVIEKNFNGAKIYPEAVEVARETLTTLKAGVEQAQQTFKTKKAEFEAGVAASSEVQKPSLLAARQRELTQGEAALAAAEKAKIKWPLLVVRSDKNLDAFAKKIPTELNRLKGIDVAKLRQSVQLAEQGEKELADKKAAAPESIASALKLWPTNELAKRLQPEAAALKTTLAAAAAAATPVATPKPKPTPRPQVAVEETPQPEPEKSFLLTPAGIVTSLVVVALLVAGWFTYKKLKGRANEVLE
jgi:hypothetical protein